MLEILSHCVTAAAMARCSWLLVGLVRVIRFTSSTHAQVGYLEVLTFELRCSCAHAPGTPRSSHSSRESISLSSRSTSRVGGSALSGQSQRRFVAA
jgi:hypothetical protein